MWARRRGATALSRGHPAIWYIFKILLTIWTNHTCSCPSREVFQRIGQTRARPPPSLAKAFLKLYRCIDHSDEVLFAVIKKRTIDFFQPFLDVLEPYTCRGRLRLGSNMLERSKAAKSLWHQVSRREKYQNLKNSTDRQKTGYS